MVGDACWLIAVLLLGLAWLVGTWQGFVAAEWAGTMVSPSSIKKDWPCRAFGVGAIERGGMDTHGWADSAGGAIPADAGLLPVLPAPSRTMASRTR